MKPLRRDHQRDLTQMLGLQTATAPAEPAASPAQSRDPVSGLPDAQHFRRAFSRAAMGALRSGEPMCLALLGLDDLEAVRHTGGQSLVDQTVFAAGRRFRASFRAADLLARWTADGLAVLLPRTDLAGGVRALEKSIEAFASQPFVFEGHEPFDLGVSGAVVPLEPAAPFMEAIDQAERCLRAARGAGGGRVHWPGGQLALFVRRTLVISEDEASIDLLRAFCLGSDDQMLVLDQAREALAHIETMLPNLVVIDLGPVAEQGFHLLWRVRRTAAAAGIPIVVLGGEPHHLPTAFALGADEFLTKPLWPQEVHARIDRLLARRSRIAPRALAATASPAA